jgi:glyoxylase-like metal-dependent hydrolase (beta-lactamase superfamily II)
MTTKTSLLFAVRAAPPFMKNGFVLGCDETREGILIDPGDEVDELLEIASAAQLAITYILLTHAHFDHIVGVEAAREATKAPVGLHPDDNDLYARAVEQGELFGMRVDQPGPVDFFYRGTDPITFGHYEVRPHHTPGHCPGGVCLQVGGADDPTHGKLLIVGDTLFAGSIGRTDLPGGDLDVLLDSIRTVLFAFPDDAIVWPGHGPKTTIGQERRTNPFLLERR